MWGHLTKPFNCSGFHKLPQGSAARVKRSRRLSVNFDPASTVFSLHEFHTKAKVTANDARLSRRNCYGHVVHGLN